MNKAIISSGQAREFIAYANLVGFAVILNIERIIE